MHRFFDERLVPHVDPAVAALVRFVWAYEGQGGPDTAVEQLLAVCRGAIGYFAGLAQGPPPADWAPLPIPKPIAWEELSDEERFHGPSQKNRRDHPCARTRIACESIVTRLS